MKGANINLSTHLWRTRPRKKEKHLRQNRRRQQETRKFNQKEASATRKAFPGTKLIRTMEQTLKCNTGSQTKLKNKNIRETAKRNAAQLDRQELEEYIFNIST